MFINKNVSQMLSELQNLKKSPKKISSFSTYCLKAIRIHCGANKNIQMSFELKFNKTWKYFLNIYEINDT